MTIVSRLPTFALIKNVFLKHLYIQSAITEYLVEMNDKACGCCSAKLNAAGGYGRQGSDAMPLLDQ